MPVVEDGQTRRHPVADRACSDASPRTSRRDGAVAEARASPGARLQGRPSRDRRARAVAQVASIGRHSRSWRSPRRLFFLSRHSEVRRSARKRRLSSRCGRWAARLPRRKSAAASAAPSRMSRSLISSLSSPKNASTSRAITAPPTITGARSGSSGRSSRRSLERHRGKTLQLLVECVCAQLGSVDSVAVVLVEAEGERGEARDRPGDADRGARYRSGCRRARAPRAARAPRLRHASSSSCVGGSECRNRSVRRTEPMSRLSCQRNAVRAAGDELGRAAADVDDHGPALERAAPT